MSATIPRELMLLVERVVRPVPVSLKRKKRMRDEFLEHLHVIHAEELARDGDSVAALARTQKRFGDPVDLTAELQQSLANGDRWYRWLEWCVMQRSDESIARYALRLAVVQLVMTSVILWLAPLPVGLAVISFMALGFGGLLFFGLQWGYEWEHERRWNRLALQLVGLLASFPASIAVLLMVAGGSPTIITIPWLSLAGLSLFSLILGPIFGVLHNRDMIYLHRWAELDLDAA